MFFSNSAPFMELKPVFRRFSSGEWRLYREFTVHAIFFGKIRIFFGQIRVQNVFFVTENTPVRIVIDQLFPYLDGAKRYYFIPTKGSKVGRNLVDFRYNKTILLEKELPICPYQAPPSYCAKTQSISQKIFIAIFLEKRIPRT